MRYTASLLDDDVEETGELSLSATDFDDGERMPDYVGYANDNDSPELEIGGVPAGTQSLVLDDPDARPIVGFTYDHWLVRDIDPDLGTIPRGREPSDGEATAGYSDFVEDNYGGPSPPDEAHEYRFKLLALDAELGIEPPARKAVVDMTATTEAEVLASAQLIGEYAPEQGTAF